MSHKASKETWPEKNQLRVEKKNRLTDRTNVPHQTKNGTTSFLAHWQTPGDTKEYPCIWNFWTTAPRGDGGEIGLSSGTSAPIASRDDGAVFLTAANTNKRSVRRGFLLRTQHMIFFQHRVWKNEQTVRVCAVYASLIPIRRKACFFNFFKFVKHFETLKRKELPRKHKSKLRVKIVLNNKEDPKHDATTHALMRLKRKELPKENTKKRPRVNIVLDGTKAPMHDGAASAAVPHVPDVRTSTRFSKCSIDKTQTTGKRN